MSAQPAINQENLATNANYSSRPPFMFKGKPINNKKVMTPLKLLIYGYNGVGKSTFASHAKNPIFLDLEGNIDHLSVDKQPLSTYDEVCQFLNALIHQDHDYKTVIIDSIDKLEVLITDRINSLPKSETSYGQGYVKLSKEIHDFLTKLDALRNIKKINIILIGHSTVERCENPLTQVYDKYDLRVNKRFASPICDWCQSILFAVNDVMFEETEKVGFKERERVRTADRRIIYTMGNTAFLAKNVYNLPPKIPMDWNDFINGVRKFYEEPGETQ